jgi:GAF domain-containing protein
MGLDQVAFFRNLNLGQGVSPTRPQLLEAFAGAGVTDALSFQVNGTVAFDPAGADPRSVGEQVARLLTPVCEYADVAVVRSVDELRALDLEVGDGVEVACFDGPSPFPEPLPWTPRRGDVHVVHATNRLAVAINHVEHRTAATPSLEALLGVPVTSRGAGTVRRLLARLG